MYTGILKPNIQQNIKKLNPKIKTPRRILAKGRKLNRYAFRNLERFEENREIISLGSSGSRISKICLQVFFGENSSCGNSNFLFKCFERRTKYLTKTGNSTDIIGISRGSPLQRILSFFKE